MVTIKNLKFNYPKSTIILDQISLDFVPGNIYGLFGRNGEGKSTLMKIMTGLLFPKEGSCTIFGESTSSRTVKGLQDSFMVPEDFELSPLTIATYARLNAPFYPKFSKERFYGLIKEFHLSPKDKIPNLSFGQQKKVLIAFGIACNTQFLLMDEPTNGLDIPSKSQFRKIMAAAVDEGKCIIISTHQVRDLHSLINHVVILENIKVLFDRSLSQVSEKLWFGKPSQGAKEKILYSEPSFGGKSVLERKEKPETEVDLELLFNALLEEPSAINYALKTNDHEHAI